MADQAEVVALCDVLPGGRLTAGVLLGHESVAEVDVKIGRIGQGVGQGLPINGWVGLLIQVRIGRDREGELATRRPRRVERVLAAAGELLLRTPARAEFVVVAHIRLQGIDDDLDRLSRWKLLWWRGLSESSLLRSISYVSLDVLVGQNSEGNRAVRRPAENQVECVRRHRGAKLAAVAFQPLPARLGGGLSPAALPA